MRRARGPVQDPGGRYGRQRAPVCSLELDERKKAFRTRPPFCGDPPGLVPLLASEPRLSSHP
eukprot:8406382-Lingulodinium_polyedra.AAC.1